MREATVQDLKTERQVFTDAWNFLKKWYFIDGSDDQWAQLVAEAKEMHAKTNDNELSKDITLALMGYIEKAYLQREQGKQSA